MARPKTKRAGSVHQNTVEYQPCFIRSCTGFRCKISGDRWKTGSEFWFPDSGLGKSGNRRLRGFRRL